MTEEQGLWEGAEEWLRAAGSEANAGRLRVAFEAARHSAELSAKALLLRKQGNSRSWDRRKRSASYPKSHTVASELHRSSIVPKGVEAKQLRSRERSRWRAPC